MNRFRWLHEGEVYAYTIRPGKGLDERRGQPCWVLVVPRGGRGGPKNALVEFQDGHRAIVSAWNLRKPKLYR